MKRNYKKNVIIIILIYLLLLPFRVSAIGQITTPIIIEDALRNHSYDRIMVIINTENSEEEIGISANGDIGLWAEFFSKDDQNISINSIKLKEGERADIITRFSIPPNTPDGKYTGNIYVLRKSDRVNTERTSSTVVQKIGREVTINVNDKEIVNFDVSVIPDKYDLRRNEPLKIRLIYDNRGNIDISPVTQIKIEKDGRNIWSAIFPFPESVMPIKPLEIREIPELEISLAGFEKGKYSAELVFLNKEQKVLEKIFKFSIDIKNTDTDASLFTDGKIWSMIGLSMVIILIAIIMKSTETEIALRSSKRKTNKDVKTATVKEGGNRKKIR